MHDGGSGATEIVLDTDIGTDVDDALALAYALRHPGLELLAVTTVSGDAALRARIAAKLLRLAGRDDIEVAAGIAGGDPRAWMGHEGDGLLTPDERLPISKRDAVTLLVEAGPVELVVIGMQSNVAAALERGARPAHLTVMGGLFASVSSGGSGGAAGIPLSPAADHNLNCDPDAAVRALNAGIPTRYVPLDVTIGVALRERHLEALRGGDALCRALARLVEIWSVVLRRRAGDRLPADVVSLLHDPLTVASVVEPRLVRSEQRPITVVAHGGIARSFVDPLAGSLAEVVTAADGDAFADHWLETVLRRS